ncbi:nuclear transport factor 2 family protein [Streptomyces sp. NPDC005476]|uniref:nuclear transport factor 2 family protein n=1 Tax=Streptomyces sp. NPDC005476 TaxID=3156882 RepID=UPI003453B526
MTADLQQAVAHYVHALDELHVAELEAILTEDTTRSFTMRGQGVLGPAAGRAAVLDFIRDGHTAQTRGVRGVGVALIVTDGWLPSVTIGPALARWAHYVAISSAAVARRSVGAAAGQGERGRRQHGPAGCRGTGDRQNRDLSNPHAAGQRHPLPGRSPVGQPASGEPGLS